MHGIQVRGDAHGATAPGWQGAMMGEPISNGVFAGVGGLTCVEQQQV